MSDHKHDEEGVRMVWPVTWRDEDGTMRNTWSMNRFTGEIYRDPEGDPLFTTTPQVTE